MARILTALVLLPLLWGVTQMESPWAFWALAGLVIAIASWECLRLFELRGARPFRWIGVAAALVTAWAFTGVEPTFEPGLPLVAVAVVAPILAMWRRPDPASMVDAVVGTVFPVLFIGLTIGYVVRIRAIPGEEGRDLLYLLIVCVILADIAAFYVGTSLGRTRMAPRISPNKSWEGALGGVLASVGGAVLAHFWFYQRLPLVHALVLGALIALTALLGDLAESMLKRAAAVKDASSLLPGHGGVLDRVDSLLFSGPVLYYYYVAFLRGP